LQLGLVEVLYPAFGFIGAPAGQVLEPGFDPDVFDAEGGNLATDDDADVGNAALAEQALGGTDGADATDPVHDLGGG
jgi:hypothetical protein